MATEVLKQEADNDGFVTDETEVTVVGDGDDDLGAHLAQPDEDNGRRRILRGQALPSNLHLLKLSDTT